MYLSATSSFKARVLNHVHNSPLVGYSSNLKSLHKAKQNWDWQGKKFNLKRHIKECEVCQRVNSETIAPAKLLQPFSIPSKPWEEVSMDFMVGLPKSQGFDVIMVVMYRLTKYVHFVPLYHPCTTAKVALFFLFFQNVFKLHGMPTVIVSDRDAIFTSNSFSELFRLQGTELAMSIAYHPQTDGQIEVVNKSLEQYLRAFSCDKPTKWAAWLTMAEYWFNTNFHAATMLPPKAKMHPIFYVSCLKLKLGA